MSDEDDPLAGFRARFALPDGITYLDGNSLGALPVETPRRLARVIAQEWGEGLISSWNMAEWVTAPQRIGDKIARLIGAQSGEVIACDSTSVNIFKLLTAALSLNPGRRTILSEAGNFPTDVYIMQGVEKLAEVQAKLVPPEDIASALNEDVAVLLLTQVHYKSGAMRDLAATTALAHAKGILVIWDLSHSAGAVPVDLTAAEADFAVGCGYKHLNGGPGAPAFLYVAQRHQAKVSPALSGWFGHAAPFAFEDRYEPAPGIARFLCGTPPILGLAALEVGIDLALEADMAQVRAKSMALGALFAERMTPLCAAHGFALASPADPAVRGSQISYAHPQGYAIMQALISHGVIGDFRTPDILRFGLTPLYTRFADVARAVEVLDEIMATRAWDQPQFKVRAAVT